MYPAYICRCVYKHIYADEYTTQSLWRSKKKPSARIERILLHHQDINHCVVWKKGKENLANFISRHAIPLHKLPQRIAEETREHQKLLFLLHNTPLFSTAITRERLHEAQLNNTNLTRLRHFIAINQPPHNDPTLWEYYRLFNELSIENAIIHRGVQMLLPKSLQQEAISRAHEGSYPGQDANKHHLRAHFWFLGMDNAIKLQVENCHECQITTATPIKAPLTSTLIPEKPRQNVSIDLFSPLPDQRHILVVRCNLSRFPDAKIVRSTGDQYVLPALGEIYKNFGDPECHKCDNGAPFNGQEFHNWSTKRCIKIKASYPYHPQGNKAECFINSLKKSNPNRTWKTTPNPGNHWWASPWLPFYSTPCHWIDTWKYDAHRWLPNKVSSTNQPHWKPNPESKNSWQSQERGCHCKD